jgi:hypothetical protein
MSLIQWTAGLRGARFQAVFARSRSAGIGWDLWGMLPHLLPQRSVSIRSAGARLIGPPDIADELPRPYRATCNPDSELRALIAQGLGSIPPARRTEVDRNQYPAGHGDSLDAA